MPFALCLCAVGNSQNSGGLILSLGYLRSVLGLPPTATEVTALSPTVGASHEKGSMP